jgi:hypothetical protein
VFGDGELVWVERDASLAVRLVAGDLGRSPATLATIPAPSRATIVHAAFGANRSSALLYALFERGVKGGNEPVGTIAVAGPRGALRPLGDEGETPYAFPKLVGDRVASPFAAPDHAFAIRFLDPVSGARTDVPVAPPASPWDAAGDLLAARIAGRPSVAGTDLRVPLRCAGSEGSGCVTDLVAFVRRRGRPAVRLTVRDTGLAAGERRRVALRARRALPRGRLRITVLATAPRAGGVRELRRFRIRG